MRIDSLEQLAELDFDKGGGLLTVVVQEARSGAVLMVAWADAEAVRRTLETGVMHFHSRSRGELWRKGATSGNEQRLAALFADCDGDTLLALVLPEGPACHTGDDTCFGGYPTLAELDRVILGRAEAAADADANAASSDSYTARLLGDANLRLKKIGEEATEVVMAAADPDSDALAEEAADLVYHLLVACRARGLSLVDVVERLRRRR